MKPCYFHEKDQHIKDSMPIPEVIFLIGGIGAMIMLLRTETTYHCP
jgi:hypothetical protein